MHAHEPVSSHQCSPPLNLCVTARSNHTQDQWAQQCIAFLIRQSIIPGTKKSADDWTCTLWMVRPRLSGDECYRLHNAHCSVVFMCAYLKDSNKRHPLNYSTHLSILNWGLVRSQSLR
jgi:hypothetical protein